MAKVKKRIVPKDRTGQKFRCYRVVRTIPKDPDGRYHVLKCSECGAQNRSRWNATSRSFCPIPCECGDLRFSNLKTGDIRNNKEILAVKVTSRGKFRKYEVLVKCLNCGAKSTITNINRLITHPDKPQMYCRHCKGKPLRVSYIGRKVGTWKIIEEDEKKMTCRCLRCRHQIVMPRKHIGTLKKRECPKCLKRKKKVDRNKIMYVMYQAGYPYYAIGEYFGLQASSVKEVVDKVAPRYEGPK